MSNISILFFLNRQSLGFWSKSKTLRGGGFVQFFAPIPKPYSYIELMKFDTVLSLEKDSK